MGLGAFLVFAVIVVVLASLAIFVSGKLAPGHPAIIDSAIWVLAALIILYRLAQAMGLLGHDIQIPQL